MECGLEEVGDYLLAVSTIGGDDIREERSMNE